MINRVELDFCLPVELTDDEQKALQILVKRICDRHCPEGWVYWASGIGSRPIWQEPEEPDFDHTVFSISTCAREAYPSEILRAERKAKRKRSVRYRLFTILHRALDVLWRSGDGRSERMVMGKVTSVKSVNLPDFIPNEKPVVITSTRQVKWVRVTPGVAANWLEAHNRNNRTIRQDHVARLAADMKSGKWRGQNGEAIRFDTENRLIDGQHRLLSCISSGVPFDSLLITGVDPEDYSTIDTGKSKSMADFLGPVHGAKNVHLLSAVLRLVYAWVNGQLDQAGKKTATISELELIYRDHPKLSDSVDRVSAMSNVVRLMPPAYIGLIHYAATLEGRSASVESFFERLGNGLGLLEDDPVYQLRKFLLAQIPAKAGRRRPGRIYVLALTIKAWNASKSGKAVTSLRFRPEESFPVL